jgi:hypothetical protein
MGLLSEDDQKTGIAYRKGYLMDRGKQTYIIILAAAIG